MFGSGSDEAVQIQILVRTVGGSSIGRCGVVVQLEPQSTYREAVGLRVLAYGTQVSGNYRDAQTLSPNLDIIP